MAENKTSETEESKVPEVAFSKDEIYWIGKIRVSDLFKMKKLEQYSDSDLIVFLYMTINDINSFITQEKCKLKIESIDKKYEDVVLEGTRVFMDVASGLVEYPYQYIADAKANLTHYLFHRDKNILDWGKINND